MKTTRISSFLSIHSFMALLTVTMSTASFAQNDFAFEEITLSGSGCPSGSASVTPAPDKKSLSIIFDKLSAQVPQTDGQNDNTTPSDDYRGGRRDDLRVSHKVCNIIIGARVPEKTKLNGVLIEADLRGATMVDLGAKGSYRGQLLEWKGPNGALNRDKNEIFKKAWQGPATEDWTVNASKTVKANSGCAARGDRQVRLVLKNTLLAELQTSANPNTTSGLITVDSADLGGHLRVKLDLKPCGGPHRR